MAMPEASSTAIIGAGGEFTATLPRVAVQMQQPFLDALHAGQARKGCAESTEPAWEAERPVPGIVGLAQRLGLTR
jgi:hypothetical protein